MLKSTACGKCDFCIIIRERRDVCTLRFHWLDDTCGWGFFFLNVRYVAELLFLFFFQHVRTNVYQIFFFYGFSSRLILGFSSSITLLSLLSTPISTSTSTCSMFIMAWFQFSLTIPHSHSVHELLPQWPRTTYQLQWFHGANWHWLRATWFIVFSGCSTILLVNMKLREVVLSSYYKNKSNINCDIF